MEGRMVEKMVEEVGGGSGEKWREVAGQGKLCCCFYGCSLACWLEKDGGKKRNERERREWVFLYIRVKLLLQSCPPIKAKETQEWRLASPCSEARVWATKAGRGDKSASRRINASFSFDIKD